jgi:GNAT superfamily N-acetyltransferase
MITAPVPIDSTHCLGNFDCGVPVLNEWLKRRALPNEVSGASRTFVVCTDRRVIGFYALATGSVRRIEAPGRIRRNMPEPIPVMVLGRLAVDLRQQGKGVGAGLLKDAILRTITVAKQAGIRALVAHALSEEVRDFYLRHGFLESPLSPMTLMLSVVDWNS